MKEIEIETKRYKLRGPKIEDAEEIYEKWGTDKEKMAQYKEHKVYRNVIEAKDLIIAAIKETENGVIFLMIESKEDKQIIGYVKLKAWLIKDKICEVAFYFLKPWKEDGSPEEVLTEVINHIFSKKEYETIVMKFYDANKKDTYLLQKILTKIGMVREGILRDRLINEDGKKVDKYVYSILKEEWKKTL